MPEPDTELLQRLVAHRDELLVAELALLQRLVALFDELLVAELALLQRLMALLEELPVAIRGAPADVVPPPVTSLLRAEARREADDAVMDALERGAGILARTGTTWGRGQ